MATIVTKADLIAVLGHRWTVRRAEIEAVRQGALASKSKQDWIWPAFMTCYATNGGVRHFESEVAPRLKSFSWAAVSTMTPEERQATAQAIVNPRRRALLIPAFHTTYARFSKKGPDDIRRQYEAHRTAASLMAWLQTFDGIGKKYSRNLPLDSADPRMDGYFAIDVRILSILEMVLNPIPSYEDAEEYLRGVAAAVGISSWHLDRLLFWDVEQIATVLRAIGRSQPAPITALTSKKRYTGGCGLAGAKVRKANIC